MAKFDLSKYATVEERLRAFWSSPLTEDARIVTHNLSLDDKTWVIKTEIFLTAGDQAADLPKVTGWASEANTDAFALERCETSSIGRCLANWLWTGAKPLDGTPRPSQEEMAKVALEDAKSQNFGSQPKKIENKDYLAEAKTAASVEQIRDIYRQAQAKASPKEVLEQIKALGESLATK